MKTYNVEGNYNDLDDRMFVKKMIEKNTNWKCIIPQNTRLKCTDLLVMKNSKIIYLEIERSRNYNDIRNNYKDVTIPPRKSIIGNTIWIKLSKNRWDCVSAPIESFLKYGYKSDRIDKITQRHMIALEKNSPFLHWGWKGFFDLLGLA